MYIAHIKDDERRMVTDEAEKKTVLNMFFSSVITQEKEGYTNHDCIVSSISQDIPLWLTILEKTR